MKIGISAIIIIASLLAACTIDPVKDNAAAINKAEAKGLPILVYSRRENDQLDFINVSTHPIKEIDLELGICVDYSEGQETAAERRQTKGGLLVTIKGEFQPGLAFKVRHAKVDLIDKSINTQYGDLYRHDWRSRIVAARIVFADGTRQRIFVKKDVQPLLTKRVGNSCSIDSTGMPADMQFIHT